MAKTKAENPVEELEDLPVEEVEDTPEEEPKQAPKTKKDNFPSDKELKEMSEERRNDVLKARAKKNAEAPRDLEDLMPSQMTVEEMQSCLKKYKINFAKTEKPAELRAKIREFRNVG